MENSYLIDSSNEKCLFYFVVTYLFRCFFGTQGPKQTQYFKGLFLEKMLVQNTDTFISLNTL